MPTRPTKVVSRTYAAVPLSSANPTTATVVSNTTDRKTFDAHDLERSRPPSPAVERSDDIEDSAGDETAVSSDDNVDDNEGEAVEALHGIWDPYKNRWRLLAVSLINLANGLNDSAAGALLPYIERHFHIGYAVVSLIFVGLAFGSIMAAACVDPIKRRLGRARTLALAQCLMAVGYIPMLLSPRGTPFVAVVFGFFAVGFGEAVNLAMGNTFCASLRQSTFALGVMHGSYGIGGISGPLIATAVVVASGATENTTSAAFSHYYFVPFGLILLSAVLGAWSFAGFERDIGEEVHSSSSGKNNSNRLQRLRHWHRSGPQSPSSQPSTAPSSRVPSRVPSRAASPERNWNGNGSTPLTPSVSRPFPTPLQSSNQTPMDSFSSSSPFFSATPPPASSHPLKKRRSLAKLYDMFTRSSSKVVLLGALFLFAYQGAEVTIAGWVTSFLISVRGGTEPGVGYVTAGFWGGITLGRFVLASLAQRVGERLFVYLCVAGAAIFELLVWFVPNVIGDAVAVSIIGLLLGPVYPCAAALLMRGLSRRERVTGVGVMAAFGSAGGAAAPFITGVIAQAVGTFVLHPIALGLFGLMVVFWWQVPAIRKRTE